MNTREQNLAACLHWLRSHYEQGRSRLKAEVLNRVERVLADGPELNIDIMVAFREKYKHNAGYRGDNATAEIEPSPEMIEAVLIATGLAPKIRQDVMESLPRLQGTAHEPGVCSQVRAVLAIISGVPLEKIKRGYRP